MCFLTAGSDEASQPINNHLECVEMLAESEQTLSLARHDIFTNSVRWRNVVSTRRPGLYHNMSTSLISIMVARTNIGISTYAWAETIIALLSVPYLLNIEKQDDAYVYKLLQQTAHTGHNYKHEQKKKKEFNLLLLMFVFVLMLVLWAPSLPLYLCLCLCRNEKKKKQAIYVCG